MPSTYFWIGSAAPVAQVDVRVPAAVNIGNDFSITRNGKSVTFRATAATAANVTAGLAAAVAASVIPEFKSEITATDLVGTISFTAKTPGKPFPATYSAAVGTGGGAPTFAASGAQTASAGPNHWDSAGNWKTAAGAFGVPVTGDGVIFETGNVPCLYGLDQSGVTLALLEMRRSYNGLLGLPRYNAAGYFEDRPDYLKIGATIQNIDTPSQRVKIDNLAVQTAVNAKSTGSPLEENVPAFCWKGTNVANTFQMTKGYAGIAYFPGEAAALADLNVGYQTNRDSDVNLWAGSGLTFPALSTIDKNGGILYLKSDLITFAQRSGTTYLEGDGLDVTTLKIDGGNVFYSSDGVITNLVNSDDGSINFDGTLRPCTVTNCDCYGDIRQIIDNETRVVWTNGIKLHHGSLGSASLQLGEDILITVAKLP